MEENVLLTMVIRSLGTAWRASRLYPLNSPMAVEAAQRVCDAVEEYVQAEPSLKLDVVRGGFVLRGLDGVLVGPGVPEFADTLGEHGVGELHFVAPPEPEEVAALMAVAQERPHELHEKGGMQAFLVLAEVGSIQVIDVVLSRVEAPPEIPEDEADKFLTELAADAGRLAVWLRSLLVSDDEGLSEGILTLANAAAGVEAFGRTMAESFRELETDDKDRLLESSIKLEPIQHVMVEMLANLSAIELTAAIRGGCYGKNLMALSYALTNLPVGDRSGELFEETSQALRAAEVDEARILFLERMVGLRSSAVPEPPLIERQPEYHMIFEAAQLDPQRVALIRQEAEARQRLDAVGVAELLHLLDLADGSREYSNVLGSLARSVPNLLRVDPQLAMSVVREISRRSESSEKPWPGLDATFALAMEEACGPDSMSSLLCMYVTDERAVELARELVTLGGEPSAQSLASVSLESEEEDSIEFAEAVLGRRLPEILAQEASRVEARDAAKLAELFARDGGPNCMRAIGQLVARPEEQVRSRTARGIVAGGGQAVTAYMPKLLRDESSTVMIVAVSALAQSGQAGTVEMLAKRLGELEGDKELPIAREIIKLIGSSPSPAAEKALMELAGKGSFLRKSRYAELKRLAQEALKAREVRGGA